MQSPYFTADHELFRQTVRQFMENEVVPHAEAWEKEQRIPRSIWKKMGELGFLGINFPEQYGGAAADFFYSVVFLEEVGRTALGGFAAAVAVQQYMATAHLYRVGTEALKQNYLIPSIKGEKVGALAITEPNAGSDVANIQTRAEREGDHYIIRGSKTFITNGVYGDFITVAVKTRPDAGVDGISLIVVDRDTPGLSARKLQKIGWHCSDTAELSFDDVKVPVSQRIGEENMGFYYIMESFQLERLVAALTAIGGMDKALEVTLQYITERTAFGRPLARFQVIRHALADIASELEAARQLTYYAAYLCDRGESFVREASMAKLLTSELGKRMADVCLQYFGGYGYMEDYPIARMYRDARVGTIAGGTSEIMREIISRVMIDQVKYDSVYEQQKERESEAAPERAAKPASEREKEAPDLSTTSHEEDTGKKPDAPEMAKRPETVAEIFNTLPQRFRADKAGDFETVIHFDISGKEGGLFTVRIHGGRCEVREGLHGEARCVVKTKDKTYKDIELGRANPQVAFMMGKIKVSNVSEMLKFIGLFRPLKDT